MPAKAQQVKLRLFLEGAEVPVIAAQISSAANGPAQAAIQIPPTALATKLLPRTVVHLFFADPYEAQNPFVSFRGGDQRPQSQDPTAYEQSRQTQQGTPDIPDTNFVSDTHNVKYKLLFGGEMVGFAWTKNVNASRSMVLQCLDFSNYWDYAYQFNNTDLFGPGLKAVFSGGSTNLLTDFLSSPGEILASLLHQPSAQYPGLKGFLGGLIRMLEGIGGSYFTDNKFSGQNIFYSLAELRLHITQMITTFQKDDTASRLLNAGGYDGLFGRTLGNLGEQVSIRTALTALMGIIFHEAQSVTTPYYIPGTAGTVSGSVRQKFKDLPDFYFIYATAGVTDNLLTDMIAELESAKNPATAPLQQSPDKNKAAFLVRLKQARSTIGSTSALARQKGVTSPLQYFSTVSTNLGVIITKLNKDWYPGSFNVDTEAVVTKMRECIDLLRKIEDLDINTTAKTKQIPARLCTHILKPDIWFGAPPRCNVLFPDHYHTAQYQRNYLQEPTRFLLKVNNEFFGEDELFDQFYYSPRTRTVKAQKKTLQALFSNDVMNHELFTGVLPVFEKMGELNIFAVRSGTVAGKNPKIGLAQRSANFLYFKHRFASRQMMISGRFNPYLASGFPCLVIDKYVDPAVAKTYQDQLQKLGKKAPELTALLGTHFLGSIVSLTHAVSQKEGRTDVQLGFAREYNELTEFFGPDILDDQEVQRRFGNDALRQTTVAALSPPPFQAIGPNFGTIEAVKDVTKDYTNPDAQTAFKFPLWSGPRRDGTGQLSTLVPIGPVQSAARFGDAVVSLVGDPNKLVRFNAYEVTEKVPQYRRETVDLPAEELIRPGWYGDCWHPARVGEVYFSYLGTGAITDKTQISDPGGLPNQAQQTGNPNMDEVDALAQMKNVKDGNDPKFSSAVALLTLDKDSSIEQAVRFILLTYSYVRSAGIDVDEFIKAYTWRPIATMVDMFGTSDLQLSQDGTKVLQGIEGFHSRAFGPYNDLFGLVNPDITSILGIDRVNLARQRGDVRGRRQTAVIDLINSLQFSRAIIG